MGEQILSLSLGMTPHRSRGEPGGGCDPMGSPRTPWGAHAGAGSWQDLQTHAERSPRLSRFAGRACDPVGMTHAGAAPEGLHPVGGIHTGAGEECVEEGAAETTCDELTPMPIPCPPAPLVGRKWRKSGVKLRAGRREGWGKVFLRFGFYFSLSYSDLIGNKRN